MEALRPIEAGLGKAPDLTLEQTAARQTHLCSHSTGDDFGLVEPALLPSAATGRRPRHDIDVMGADAVREQPIDEETGEVVGELPTIPVLEPEQDVASTADERHRGDHIAADRHGRRCREGETTRPAQHGTDPVTTGTTRLEHHAAQHDVGLSQSFGATAQQALDHGFLPVPAPPPFPPPPDWMPSPQ